MAKRRRVVDIVVPTNKVLSALPGSLLLAGRPASLNKFSPATYSLSASAGAFALTGPTAALYYGAVTPMTTPVLTKTSAAGAYPITFDVALNFDDTFAGYTLHVESSAGSLTPTKHAVDSSYDSGRYTSGTVQSILHTLTESEMLEPSEGGSGIDITADGFVTWLGAGSLHARVERDDGVVSGWSNDITDTITSGIAALVNTTGAYKHLNVVVSGTGNLVMTAPTASGQMCCVAATLPMADTIGQVEITLTTFITANDIADLNFGFYPATGGYDLSLAGAPGSVASAGINFRTAMNYANNNIGCTYYDTTWHDIFGINLPNNNQAVDTLTVGYNRSGAAGTHSVTIWRTRGGIPTFIGSATGLDMTNWTLFYAGLKAGHTVTINFGATAFAKNLGNGGYNG